MADLGQLYARLVIDTDRDDLFDTMGLAQAKFDAVADAIELHADEPFWFNRASGTGDTSDGEAALALPDGIRFARIVACDGEPLTKVALDEIDHRTETGRPTRWAEKGAAIRLWPIPDRAYTLFVHGLSSAGVPPSAAEANHWTIEGYRLIVATAKKLLYGGTFRDPEGYALAAGEEQEALAKLRRETQRRNRAGLVAEPAFSRPAGFDIVAG